MAKTSINIKADKEVKEQAQKVAGELGMPLSTIINAYLKQFIRTKEVYFAVEEELTPEAKQRLDRLHKEALAGENISPAFSSGSAMDDYLNENGE